MALMKCSECGKDISDKAAACPYCGNPINGAIKSQVQVSADPNQPLKIEPELTSKKWKKVKIIGWIVFVGGLFIMTGGNETAFGAGISVSFIGVVILVIAYIGAWYADKRTR
ncbi:zinc-ribbon domain-containing protein [Patescibacteria group bacterium]|nr:zinc-ribbon domain-containing protein [Patescibacteria group bacterium]